MIRGFIRVALCTLALGLALPGQAQESATLGRIKKTNTVNIGVRDSSVPFSFLDENKQPVGYSIDLCVRIVESIRAELKLPKLQVNFVPVSSSTRIPAVKEGKIDLECGSTTNTRSRQQDVAFAYTTFVAGIKMVARKSANIKGIEDLAGKTVVLTKGTTAEGIINTINTERRLGIKVIQSPDHAQSFQAVEQDRAAAFVMDDVLLYGLIAKSKKPGDFEVVGKYLSIEPYGIMMQKGDPGFERLVNNALVNMFNNGQAKQIYERWFNSRHMKMPMSHNLREALHTPNTHPAWP
ncbi:Glutamate/aspartate import solute-binding protein [Burkholderiales bacterium]|nr:MAG: amino acid ABC transporter substrate-binding protein [Burkholderiales bacterium]CAG0997533.1 Glutamate/aspartate import solute-binding protein [Burkholderiales bacterium]